MGFNFYFVLSLHFIFYFFIFNNIKNGETLVGSEIRDAQAHEFRFIAGITRRTTSHDNLIEFTICTAAIISRRDILSAQHCLENKQLNEIQLVIGDINIRSKSIYYPYWWMSYSEWATTTGTSNQYRSNDIIIIRLKRVIPSGIPVAFISYIPPEELINVKTIGLGWGELNNKTYPEKLQTASLKVLSKENCEWKASQLAERKYYLPNNYICTVGDSFVLLMWGDSGGPLLYMHTIIAINTGTCPFPEQRFHKDKINMHINLFFYETYISEIMEIE